MIRSKLILTLVSLLTAGLLSCKKSATVTITGTVDSANGTLVKLSNEHYTEFYDSTVIKNNQFTLHSTVPENGVYSLDFHHDYPVPINRVTGWSYSFYLYVEDKARYELTADGPLSIAYNRYGLQSTSFDERKLDEFDKLNNVIRDSLIAKKALYVKLAGKALQNDQTPLYNVYNDSIIKKDNEISYSARISIKRFIKKNPSTVVTPYLMTKLSDLFENYSFYQSILDRLSPEVKKSKYYDEAANLLVSVKKIYVGAKVPNISGQDIKGNAVNIDYGKSKLTLIDFWASYCGPCREQVPELKQLYNKYKGKGLQIVSVSIDEDLKKWKHASTIDQLPWTSVCELKEQEGSRNIKNFVIKSIPSNYLVDNEGRFIGRDVSLDSIKNMMQSKKAGR
jgi:thiol-disulfide isomerase/thioredoxin